MRICGELSEWVQAAQVRSSAVRATSVAAVSKPGGYSGSESTSTAFRRYDMVPVDKASGGKQ